MAVFLGQQYSLDAQQGTSFPQQIGQFLGIAWGDFRLQRAILVSQVILPALLIYASLLCQL